MAFKTVFWKKGTVVMIDQRILPARVKYNTYRDYKAVAKAIKDMVVRGAPAIGVSAAMGYALGAIKVRTKDTRKFKRELKKIGNHIRRARPTAVNLFWACDRMDSVATKCGDASVDAIKKKLVREARLMHREDVEMCKAIGKNGGRLLKKNSTVLTHCNAGALATAGYGTALGVIRGAKALGKNIKVFADETRPFNQGSRLTAWELMADNIDTTLICDNMAGYMMAQGEIDAVVVGADRIAANGDVANKIGTYTVAILARAHGIPFYVAAPTSTIDMKTKNGALIPIEERSPKEVAEIHGVRIAPKGVKVRNPAFDPTPSGLVTAIITEKGVVRAPYVKNIKKLFK